MFELKLIKYPHVMLETICESVPLNTLNLIMVSKAVEQMETIMKDHGGMGLAANQVELPFRFFIMKPECEDSIKHFINPVWVANSEDKAQLREGCLSATGISEVVASRYNSIEVTYVNLKGELITEDYEGINSVCIQHECDHLEGRFWVDKLPREKRRKFQKLLRAKK